MKIFRIYLIKYMLKANDIYQILEKMYPEVQCELNYNSLYELLVAVVLSAQTTDAAVNKVTVNLFKEYPTIEDLSKAQFQDVHKLIKTIGLANTKAKNIIALSKKIVEEKNGEVVPNFDYLISLPGVGRKTANVVLSEGFRIPRIAVDTHVLRVSNRLNLESSSDVLKVEKRLMELFEPSMWYGVHLRLLFFGRYFCKAKNPNCENCSFTSICQYITKKHPE